MPSREEQNIPEHMSSFLSFVKQLSRRFRISEEGNQQTKEAVIVDPIFDKMIQKRVNTLLSIDIHKQEKAQAKPTEPSYSLPEQNFILQLEEYLASGDFRAVLDETKDQRGPQKMKSMQRMLIRAVAYEAISEPGLSNTDDSKAKIDRTRAIINYLDVLSMKMASDPEDLIAKAVGQSMSRFNEYNITVDKILSLSQVQILEKILQLLTDLGYQEQVKQIEDRFITTKSKTLHE